MFSSAWLVVWLAAAGAAPESPLPPEPLPEGAPRADQPPAQTAEPVVRRIRIDPARLDVELASAARQAAREGARLLVVFGASWCEPCQALEAAFVRERNRPTFRRWRVAEVDVDALPPGRALGLDLDVVPVLVKLGSDGRPRATLTGRRLPDLEDAEAVDAALRQFLRP
jgi:thioredoxin-like negative regulator of GroEL